MFRAVISPISPAGVWRQADFCYFLSQTIRRPDLTNKGTTYGWVDPAHLVENAYRHLHARITMP